MTLQPDQLKTDAHVRWAWGTGNDVWACFSAAIGGDLAQLQQLLEKTPELVRCEWHYRTPLHFAVRHNQLPAARFLLESGAVVTYTGERGWHNSPVQMALDRGFDEMLRVLQKHQEDKFHICEAGQRFKNAAVERDVATFTSLLDQHGPNVADDRGNEPLHWAVMTRNRELIDLTLERGGSINAIRPDGARPLDLTNGDYWYRGWRDSHPMAPKNHWPLVGYLISKGAEYDLTTACRVGDIERVKQLLDDHPKLANQDALYNTWYSGFPLRSAAKAGHLEIVQMLLDAGADPNKQEHGLAPIGGSVYDSTQNGHMDVLRLLLESGGSPNQEVESSGCPLSVARDQVTRDLLREHGGLHDPFGCFYFGHVDDLATQIERDPHVANDPEGFAMAAAKGKQALVELMLSSQSDLWERMPACLGEQPSVTDWMLAQGMNVNQTDWLGVHALHSGCTEKQLEKWVGLGVDLDIVDSEHLTTPLGAAARRNDLKMAKQLLGFGADPQRTGADWALPIRWAERAGFGEMVDLLKNA